MSPASSPLNKDNQAGEQHQLVATPRVLLFMNEGRDRDLLSETLSEQYRVSVTTDHTTLEEPFDCCIVDIQQYRRHTEQIKEYQTTTGPVFHPSVLLVPSNSADDLPSEIWHDFDDVIELPVSKAALKNRITNLIERREASLKLADRTDQLEQTLTDLKLKERAIDEAPIGFTISNPAEDDNPLIFANRRFVDLTGYGTDELIGRNCRFLQGDDTMSTTRSEIRTAIEQQVPVSTDIINYRKNGERFWNHLEIAPVHDDTGSVTHFVGFQTDITERKIRERRLEVMNRVLNHNLRNNMNVIEGHVSLLRNELDIDEPSPSLTEIEETASNLIRLAEAVRKIERTLTATDASTSKIDLNERIGQVLSAFKDRYPEVSFQLSVADDPCEIGVIGLMTAIEEALENAVEHNDNENPRVAIDLRTRDNEWIDIEIEDNGPGIPDQEIEVLSEGETDLNHADRLGLWLIHWVISRAGGRMSVDEATPRGTLLKLSVPVN